jgi:hypothetical protein
MIRFARGGRFFAGLVAVVVAFAAGCDECTEGETRCRGQVLETCIYDSHPANYWSEMTCPVACGEVDGGAMCVGTYEPND